MLLFLIEASSVYPRTDCLPCLGIAQVCLALCQATVCCGLCVECTQIQFKTPHPCPHTHHPIFLQSPAQSQSMFRVFKQIQKRPVNPLLVYRPLKKHRHHALSIKIKPLFFIPMGRQIVQTHVPYRCRQRSPHRTQARQNMAHVFARIEQIATGLERTL